MSNDVNQLSVRELQSLIVAAERRLKLLSRRRSPSAVRKDLTALATSLGYSIGELFGASRPSSSPAKRPTAKKKSKVAPKYRDPDNKRNTWSGRGRMPRWLADRTKRGQNAIDFLLPGLARPTTKNAKKVGRRSVYKRG